MLGSDKVKVTLTLVKNVIQVCLTSKITDFFAYLGTDKVNLEMIKYA
jgi:hypothetical protein